MRAPLLAAALVALSPLQCARAPAAGGPRLVAAPPVTLARPSLPPEADPEAFRVAASDVDVDGDGRDDRVRDLPELGLGDRRGLLREAPPSVVAHRLPDGRLALDDEVTRALLRAACPESPRATPASLGAAPDALTEETLVELFWTGFCVRAWGGTLDEAERAVRASTLPTPPDADAPALAAAASAAVRDAVLPITLAARPPEALRARRVTPEPPFAAPADPPPVDPRCAPIVARNGQRVAIANRASEAHARAEQPYQELTMRLDPRLQCRSTPAGVWSLALAPARFLLEGEPHITADTALTWAPAAGPPASLATSLVSEQFPLSSTYPGLERAFDWDGDGTPEVVLRVARYVFEAPEPDTVTLYTARGGGVRPYAPAQGFEHILSVEDVDADGRPDLVLPSPWRHCDRCGMMGVWHEGPTLTAHALPDGTFSTRDDVARAWVMRQCERAPRGGPGDALDVIDVACARAWGQAPEAVVAAARALALDQRRRDPARAAELERCMSFHELAALAAVELPFEPIDAALRALPDAPQL